MFRSCKVYLGPPGTGKTYTLLEEVDRYLIDGLTSRDIAYCSFTKAARKEVLDRAKDKFGLDEKQLPWVKTIHATAFKLLGLSRTDTVDKKRLKEFADLYGYEIGYNGARETNYDDPDSGIHMQRRDDMMLRILQWGRSRNLSNTTEIYKKFPYEPYHGGQYVTLGMFSCFCRRYGEFKHKHKILDFDDMISEAQKDSKAPLVDVAFVDEAQDLSPAQITLAEKWFSGCEKVIVAGDDDQAIYAFSGANPDWIISLAKQHGNEVLKKSYRLTSQVFEYSQKIIKRNSLRIDKDFGPKYVGGDVIRSNIYDFTKHIEGKCFVLARNRSFFRAMADELDSKAISYLQEDRNRSGTAAAIEGARAAVDMWHMRPVDHDGLMAMLGFVPSRGSSLIPHGLKSKIKDLQGKFDIERLLSVGLERVIEVIQNEGPLAPLTKLQRRYKEQFAPLIKKHGEIPDPKVIITTMHGSKGRQADTVVICPDMTRSTHDGYDLGSKESKEAENRLAYVAVTRASERLVILDQETSKSYPYPGI